MLSGSAPEDLSSFMNIAIAVNIHRLKEAE
jgi:hypothetical protein